MPSTCHSPFVCNASLSDMAPPVRVCMFVAHLNDTAALMKPVPAPHKLYFFHYILGQKEISATTIPAPASSHKWDQYCSQVTSSNRSLHVPH